MSVLRRRKNFARIMAGTLVFSGLFFWGPVSRISYADTVKEQFTAAQGIKYKHTQSTYYSTTQDIRVMEIDLNKPTALVEIGVPTASNKLEKTTSRAKAYNTSGHYVVGAINAALFNTGHDSYTKGSPVSLISKDNVLIHEGEVFEGDTSKTINRPIAFGITRSGNPLIDSYNLKLNYSVNGQVFPITSTNKVRYQNETILYTSYYPIKTTGQNEWGTEVAVTVSGSSKLEFGKTVQGTVTAVRAYGDQKQLTIPANGFILSGNGTGSDNLKKLKVGDKISVSVDIDDKWRGSKFMLASGPTLVKNGQVSISMNMNSPYITDITARTAVAIDKTGKKVFFITVDGSSSNKYKGMKTTDLAKYLVSIGAYNALYLDGGGSTTMAAVKPGTTGLTLMNQPSYGYERAVSAILMAVSTAPLQTFSDVDYDNWAYNEISDLYNKKVITGYPDGTFQPNKSLTRTEAAIMLTRALGLNTSTVTDPQFSDVPQSHPYYKEIAAAANANLFKGRGSADTFVPDGLLTRAEMAAVIQRAYHFTLSSTQHFPDVDPNHWAFKEIGAIAEQGITEGFPDGTFHPNSSITRAEFSTFLYRTNK